MYKTFQYRIKDSSASSSLFEKACGVNRIWNFYIETQKSLFEETGEWLSNFDIDKQLKGVAKKISLHSTSVQAITAEYNSKRRQSKKHTLKWRSNSKSLPWIPLKANGVRICRETGRVTYAGLEFNIWYHRPITGVIKTGSICSDARGRWYLNVVCELPDVEQPLLDINKSVGIDLGLKDLAVLSNGRGFAARRYFRRIERKLASAQSRNKRRQVRTIHAKIKNQRKDYNHKVSNAILEGNDIIFVGNVSPSDIISIPNMAKSTYDASWYQLKSFLRYKALASRKVFLEVNESYSTQTCSVCSKISVNSPKGTKGLSIRNWTCSECNTTHDRDVNSARNILQFGHELLLKLNPKLYLGNAGSPGL